MLRRFFSLFLASAVCLPGTPAGPGQAFGDRCLRTRAGGGVVRILHFGDSHLAGCESNHDFSAFFRGHYGDGGAGLALPWISRRPGVTARATPGWRKSQKAQGGDGRMGLAAGYLEAHRAGETATVEATFSRFRLHFLRDRAAGKVTITLDGQPQGELDLAMGLGPELVFDRTLTLRAGPHRLEVRTTRDGMVRLLGVALEGTAGALYSPFPFNGARASWMLAIPEDLFQAQVEAENPDLVILAFGTNESTARDFNPVTYRRELETLLARFQKAAPRATLLLAGPPDGIFHTGNPATLESVIAVQKSVAEACRALFVDQRQAMGGAGSINTWYRLGLANRDLIHMTPAGYQRLSRFCIESLLMGTGQGGAIASLDWDRMAQPALPPAPAPAAREAGSHPIYTFRNRDGRLFITDDPSKVAGQPGEWVREGRP